MVRTIAANNLVNKTMANQVLLQNCGLIRNLPRITINSFRQFTKAATWLKVIIKKMKNVSQYHRYFRAAQCII